MEDRRGHGKIKQTGGSGAGSASSVGGATRASSFEAWQDQSLDKSVSGSSQRGGDRVERRSKSYDKAEAHVAAAAAATSVSPALTRNGKSKSMDRTRKTGPPKGKSLGSMKMTRKVRLGERKAVFFMPCLKLEPSNHGSAHPQQQQPSLTNSGFRV